MPVKSLDDSAAKAIKGVKAVLRVPTDRGGEGVAIIAEGYWPASRARCAQGGMGHRQRGKPDTAQLLTQYRAWPKNRRHRHPRRCDPAGQRAAKISAEFTFPTWPTRPWSR